MSRRVANATTGLWWPAYLVVVGGGLAVAAVSRRRLTEPWLGLSLALVLLLMLGWAVRPRASLTATLFLAAISDQVTVAWFPFTKNLSSRESISYLADAVTISPIDIVLGTGAVLACMRAYARTGRVLPRSPLTKPMLLFGAFVFFGFIRGVVMLGGDVRVAVFEGRAMFYIPLVFLITAHECTEVRHLRPPLYAMLAGVAVQSLLSVEHLSKLPPAERESLDTLNEHGSALGHNMVIVVFLSLLLLKVRQPVLKWALVLALVPTVYVVFISQRRAGIAALLVAGAVVATAMFWHRRRAFWVTVPIALLLLSGYVGAFWNSTSSAAFPAQAVKSIIAPSSATAEDQSSDLYRQIEAFDLNVTIRSSPVLGLGFGQPFLRPIPLPDISFFELNAYLPHNAFLWVWIKLGFGGFVTTIYLIVTTLLHAGHRVRSNARDLDLVIALSASVFVVMYMVYTYVDISWDARNATFLGFFATAACHGAASRRSTSLIRRVGDDGDVAAAAVVRDEVPVPLIP